MTKRKPEQPSLFGDPSRGRTEHRGERRTRRALQAARDAGLLELHDDALAVAVLDVTRARDLALLEGSTWGVISASAELRQLLAELKLTPASQHVEDTGGGDAELLRLLRDDDVDEAELG